MTPEFKERWVKALTDGSFQQATGVLVAHDGVEVYHCCLGVAGALMGFNIERECVGADQLLTCEDLKKIGLSYKDQSSLAKSNDEVEVEPGEFYPRAVIERVKALPEEPYHQFFDEGAVVWMRSPYANPDEDLDEGDYYSYSYVVSPRE